MASKKCLKCTAFVMFWGLLFLFISYSSVLYHEFKTGKSIDQAISWIKQHFLIDPNTIEIRTTPKAQKKSPTTAGSKVVIVLKGKPMIYHSDNIILELDSYKYNCSDPGSAECESKTALFGKLLNMELNRVINAESKTRSKKTENKYHVQFHGSYGERGRDELLCALADVRIRTIKSSDEPFASLGFPIPDQPLFEGQQYNSCAVVSSSGALLGSKLGHLIDSNDIVIRFNNAPTKGYEEDVGGKTTMRILNSQIVTGEKFNFLEDSLYSNISIMMWDPTNQTSTLEDWYMTPDYPMFDNYKKFLELNPEANAHLLNPGVLWDLWAVLQSSAPEKIKHNPPSSGFLGIWFAMHHCFNVKVFEYVPSARATARCHYYSEAKDRACSLGTWHPLAQEKLIANKMRDNTDFEAYQLDSNDIVIRFNNAPTKGYEEDVGGKTTMRILNSQIVTGEKFNFLEDSLYSNISIMMWDPTNQTSTLEDWYMTPDYPMFDNYKKFLELNPEANAHLLNPGVLWDLWAVLQSSAPEKIKHNPPSSGFLGIWFAMHHCFNVKVFEYVPSARATARCHYYSEAKDRACSLGTWHPLAQEKLIANKMRDNTDFEAYQLGYINIPGTTSFTCPY